MSFNPRARVGRDVEPTRAPAAPTQFQSTRPRGARLHIRRPSACWQGFQSTRPRGARHEATHWAASECTGVSIHAPAWGATYDGSCCNPSC